MSVYRTDPRILEEAIEREKVEKIVKCAVETTYRTVLQTSKMQRMLELSSTGDEIKNRMNYAHLYEEDIVNEVMRKLYPPPPKPYSDDY